MLPPLSTPFPGRSLTKQNIDISAYKKRLAANSRSQIEKAKLLSKKSGAAI